MQAQASASLFANHRPGKTGLWLGRKIFQLRKLVGAIDYDDYRVERVGSHTVLVLPSVANPVALRSGSFFAKVIDAETIAPGSEVLDLGTGSGICAIACARFARRIVATDLNPAAVRCARINALINGTERLIDCREGDLFAPVAEEQFDLVLFNPPFLLGSARDQRDAAWRADGMTSRFAEELGGHLKPGGQAILMLSTFGDASEFFESELNECGYVLEAIVRKRFINETLIAVRVRRPEQRI